MDTHPVIPDKLYFKIREVSSITGLASYVLRFWETEFPEISPKRTESSQRLYRKKDIETILAIKQLLYDKKFTIEGARKHLRLTGRKKRRADAAAPPASVVPDLMVEIKRDLHEILQILEAGGPEQG
ncbi:MAG: MerR family transcriptional regulator [Deltaproteobacteria bacterium]|nr:MerR family transcriptional regulator [Deltaproteobacteria bacterium]